MIHKLALFALMLSLLLGASTPMPDTPDYSQYMPGSTRFPMTDLGELATRLGSPDTYDRRGEVVWLDSFKYGLAPWQTSLVGVGATAKVVSTDTDISDFALRLTGGSTLGGTVAIIKYFSLQTLARAGAEFSYMVPTAFDKLYVSVRRYDGTNMHLAQVRLTCVGGTWAYQDAAGAYQDIDSPGVWITTANRYHNVKLVADLENDEYLRLLYDNLEYPLSGIPILVAASPVDPGQAAVFSLTPRAGFNDYVQVGRAIVTGNEP